VQGGGQQGFAAAFQIARELDDQDAVLGRQADRGQQADLEIHIVLQAA